MINIIQRAVDVQMYVMGSSVYEERSWQKKNKQKSTIPPLPQPSSTEPSLILKCPFAHDMKSKQSESSQANPEDTSQTSVTDTKTDTSSTETTISPFNSKELISKCPYSFDIGTTSQDDSDGESVGSCPFGSIQPQIPGVSEDSYQLISNRLHSLPDDIFEKQFLHQRCVFTSFDGTMLPW